MKRALILAVFALHAIGCARQSQSGMPFPTPPEGERITDKSLLSTAQLNELERVLIVGKEIYRKDQLAWKASDIVIERIRLPDDVLGWLVHREGSIDIVSFYRGRIGTPALLADVEFDGNARPTLIEKPTREISNTERSMLVARYIGYQIVRRARTRCSDNLNTVVLPSSVENAWDVYVLSATTEPDKVMFGGHARITVSADEKAEVISMFPFTVSCLVMSKAEEDLPEGWELNSLYVSHIVSDLPSETHVFLSYSHNIRIVVTTETGDIAIENGRYEIEHLRQKSPADAPENKYSPFPPPSYAH